MRSGAAAATAARAASSARMLPWMSERSARRSRAHRSASAGGMTKEMSASQQTSPSTEATARPRPKRRPSFSMVTSRVRRSPGWTTRLKRHSSMPAKSPMRSPKPSSRAT